MHSTKHILLTIDVEDWFQVENFKPWIPFETWDQRELRVERNVHLLLDLFDSIELPNVRTSQLQASGSEPPSLPTSQLQASGSELPSLPAYPVKFRRTARPVQFFAEEERSVFNQAEADLTGASQPQAGRRPKATFFILGWLAERIPNLVREMQSRGHEVASHGYNHGLPNLLSPLDLKNDLNGSKKLLEDITGSPVFGYRAPSFAINNDILKIIEDSGYLYDSSYNSFSLHGRYGKISLNGTGKKGIAHKISDNFYELPISNLRLAGQTLPWGGGGYFRLLPAFILNLGVKKIIRSQDAYVFYAHPWEFDPLQPRVNQALFNLKFRHYTNLNKTKTRLKRLIENFRQCRFVTCNEYLMLTKGFGLRG